ncbi:peroxidase family protein [Nitrospira sp. Nam74]
MPGSHSALAVLATVFRFINRVIPWSRLPFRRLLGPLNLGVVNLPALRYDLRMHNLHDTSQLPTRPMPGACPFHPKDLTARRVDGTHNDLSVPTMGGAGTRFGRNVGLDHAWPDQTPDLFTPSPREVSRQLMTRARFIPAESLNLLAAAWIQFEVHDWFNHPTDPHETWEIRLEPGDDWHENPMKIHRAQQDPTRAEASADYPPTFLNDETHWWDASQLYGSTEKIHYLVRSFEHGRLRIEADGLLPVDPDPALHGIDLAGFNNNWWAGLSVLHTLFVREHNAICRRLQEAYPTWDDERLFQVARLVNAALIAKIHTTEWTPAILGHPALQIGMNANWWGAFGERIYKVCGRISDSEELSGIPGSPVDHHGAPYAMTEEFTSVYRLHPLLPDDYRFQSLADSQFSRYKTFIEIQGNETRQAIREIGMDNVLYSFGLANPGAIALGNYPRFLQTFRAINGEILDVATIDIMRDRERGVPRYNEFRRMLRMPRVKTFKELNPEWAKPLSDLYKGQIDRVDLMVGLFAECPPEGFGFSDTAFRIFILMASRRLKSDRFFTTDYRRDVYTDLGLQWINENGMASVLLRHYPSLAPALTGIANPFAPWRNVHELHDV